MKNILRIMGLFGSCLLSLGPVASAQEVPTYANLRVVSVDSANRTVMLRNSTGATESYVLDDLLAGTGSVKAGDQVMVTLRGGPGRQRISAISRLTPSSTSAATPVPTVQPGETDASKAARRDAFSRQVAVINQAAGPVDSAWASFVTACGVKPVTNTSGGRDWFGLWDGRVQADYSSGNCREMFNQIISSGEGIKKSMAAAEESVQNALTPGEIRDIETLHSMNWGGWTLPAPARREP